MGARVGSGKMVNVVMKLKLRTPDLGTLLQTLQTDRGVLLCHLWSECINSSTFEKGCSLNPNLQTLKS